MIQKIIKEIEREIELRKNMPRNHEQVDVCYGLNRAKDIISAIPEPGWIPVEKRLPGTECILITNGEVVKEGYCRPDGVWKYGRKEDELFSSLSSKPVIAWMPLPEPYRPDN